MRDAGLGRKGQAYRQSGGGGGVGGGSALSHACSAPPRLHDAAGGQGVGDLAGAG